MFGARRERREDRQREEAYREGLIGALRGDPFVSDYMGMGDHETVAHQRGVRDAAQIIKHIRSGD